MKCRLFLLAILLSSLKCTSFIRSITVWHVENREIVICSEEHNFGHPANKTHSQILTNMIPFFAQEGSQVIVEDLKSYTGPLQEVAGAIADEKMDSPLSHLATACQQHSIPTTNIEFRFARRVSVGPLLYFFENSRQDVDQLFGYLDKGSSDPEYIQACVEYVNGKHTIKSSSVVQEFDQAVADIGMFNDGAVLSDYYRNHLARVKIAEPLLEKLDVFMGRLRIIFFSISCMINNMH